MIAGEPNSVFAKRLRHAARVSWDRAKHLRGEAREQELRSARNLGMLAKHFEETPDVETTTVTKNA